MSEALDTFQNIYMWQGLTKTIHPLSVQQMRLLPCVVFLNAASSEIHISEDICRIKLFPYKGLKGVYNKLRYYNKEELWGKLLAENLAYFLPRNKEGKLPQIEIEWS